MSFRWKEIIREQYTQEKDTALCVPIVIQALLRKGYELQSFDIQRALGPVGIKKNFLQKYVISALRKAGINASSENVRTHKVRNKRELSDLISQAKKSDLGIMCLAFGHTFGILRRDPQNRGMVVCVDTWQKGQTWKHIPKNLGLPRRSLNEVIRWIEPAAHFNVLTFPRGSKNKTRRKRK